jgi:hypothetical protein
MGMVRSALGQRAPDVVEKEQGMATQPPADHQPRLKYSAVAVLATPTRDGQAIAELHPGDSFQVTRQEGLFYAVTLGDGREGFLFMRNLTGVELAADTPDAADDAVRRPRSAPRGGLTGWLQSLIGR